MSLHPLADLAWNVNDLMRPPGAHEWFRDQCLEYFRERQKVLPRLPRRSAKEAEAVQQAMSEFMAASWETAADPQNREKAEKAERAQAKLNALAPPLPDPALSPPLDWQRPMTLADKCAILVMLYNLVCTGEQELIEPPSWPRSFARLWLSGDFARLTRDDGLAWHGLEKNVKKLTSDHRPNVEGWLKDTEAAFRWHCDARTAEQSEDIPRDKERTNTTNAVADTQTDADFDRRQHDLAVKFGESLGRPLPDVTDHETWQALAAEAGMTITTSTGVSLADQEKITAVLIGRQKLATQKHAPATENLPSATSGEMQSDEELPTGVTREEWERLTLVARPIHQPFCSM